MEDAPRRVFHGELRHSRVHPKYEWAAVGHPSRKFGWVFARERTMDDATYDEIMQVFQEQGYDIRQFIKVPQLTFETVQRGA